LGLAACLAFLAGHYSIADPSASLLGDLAQIGVGLFIAFGVTTTAVERGNLGRAEHVNWLGFGCGTAFAALIGIGLCVVGQAYREAGHAGAFDEIAIAWATASLGVLGIAISLGPLVIYRSRESQQS